MTCSLDNLTRDEAREAFSRELTYADVQPNDIRALEGFLCIEHAQHERNGEHMEMHPTYRKAHQPNITPKSTGGIESAYLHVSGFYFTGREAISFNDDGFIGVAGWADDTNVQPFLRAFMKWLSEWMGCKHVRRSALVLEASQPIFAPAC